MSGPARRPPRWATCGLDWEACLGRATCVLHSSREPGPAQGRTDRRGCRGLVLFAGTGKAQLEERKVPPRELGTALRPGNEVRVEVRASVPPPVEVDPGRRTELHDGGL